MNAFKLLEPDGNRNEFPKSWPFAALFSMATSIFLQWKNDALPLSVRSKACTEALTQTECGDNPESTGSRNS
jgi:hypothetical protein